GKSAGSLLEVKHRSKLSSVVRHLRAHLGEATRKMRHELQTGAVYNVGSMPYGFPIVSAGHGSYTPAMKMKPILNYRSLFLFAAAVLVAGRVLAAEPTALSLIKEGNEYVGKEAKDRVVQIRSD